MTPRSSWSCLIRVAAGLALLASASSVHAQTAKLTGASLADIRHTLFGERGQNGLVGAGAPFEAEFDGVVLTTADGPGLLSIFEGAASMPTSSRVKISGKIENARFEAKLARDGDGHASTDWTIHTVALATARNILVGHGTQKGLLAGPARVDVEFEGVVVPAAEAPQLLALIEAAAGMPARSELRLAGRVAGASFEAKLEKKSDARTEAKLEGLIFADETHMFGFLTRLMAAGVKEMKVAGLIAGLRPVEMELKEKKIRARQDAITTVATTPDAAGPSRDVPVIGAWRGTMSLTGVSGRAVSPVTLRIFRADGAMRWTMETTYLGRAVTAVGTAIASEGRLTLTGAHSEDSSGGGLTIQYALRQDGERLEGNGLGSDNMIRTLALKRAR